MNDGQGPICQSSPHAFWDVGLVNEASVASMLVSSMLS